MGLGSRGEPMPALGPSLTFSVLALSPAKLKLFRASFHFSDRLYTQRTTSLHPPLPEMLCSVSEK